MDPWVDFIGVPKEQDADGSYLELGDLAQNQGVDKIVTLVDSRRPSRSKQAQSLV
jgi:hypothetical protein